MISLLIIDEICLCANLGNCRAVMSSQGASRLYCLNNEHLIPGNELEEKRVLTELSRLKNISKLNLSKEKEQET